MKQLWLKVFWTILGAQWCGEMSTILERIGNMWCVFSCFFYMVALSKTTIVFAHNGFSQSPDGSYPGLDLFTGQSHYWGAYSTAFLTEYALGVRPISVGYSQFLFAPLPSFKVEWVQGRVPTPHGLVYANWGYGSNGKIMMYITAPNGTQATIIPPFPGKWTCQGKSGQGGNVTVTGTALLYEV